jgi:hypothetical protein
MAIPNWYEGEWDLTWLNGIPVPGVVIVDVDLTADTDQQKATGRRKARTRDKGDKPHQVGIEITLSPEELEDFEPLIAVLDPGRRKGVRDPVYIENANANLWGVNTINIKKIKSPSPRDGGFWVVSIDAEEWTPEPKEVKKAKKKAKKQGESKHDYVADFLNAGQQIGPPDLLQGLRDPWPPSNHAEEGLGLPAGPGFL